MDESRIVFEYGFFSSHPVSFDVKLVVKKEVEKRGRRRKKTCRDNE